MICVCQVYNQTFILHNTAGMQAIVMILQIIVFINFALAAHTAFILINAVALFKCAIKFFIVLHILQIFQRLQKILRRIFKFAMFRI